MTTSEFGLPLLEPLRDDGSPALLRVRTAGPCKSRLVLYIAFALAPPSALSRLQSVQDDVIEIDADLDLHYLDSLGPRLASDLTTRLGDEWTVERARPAACVILETTAAAGLAGANA